jgi:hypothetical protein
MPESPLKNKNKNPRCVTLNDEYNDNEDDDSLLSSIKTENLNPKKKMKLSNNCELSSNFKQNSVTLTRNLSSHLQKESRNCSNNFNYNSKKREMPTFLYIVNKVTRFDDSAIELEIQSLNESDVTKTCLLQDSWYLSLFKFLISNLLV